MTSKVQRFALIGALYSSQNLSLGFFTYAFLTIAQARGVPLAAIGAASGIATLLTLKFLWAPLVDRFGSVRLGHYRGWLLATQTLLGLGIASLALFDPAADFGLLLGIFAVLFVVAATQDIAADATATRLLRPQERGVGNGLQSAGSSVAQVVGGGRLAGGGAVAGALQCAAAAAHPRVEGGCHDRGAAGAARDDAQCTRVLRPPRGAAVVLRDDPRVHGRVHDRVQPGAADACGRRLE
jgi:MFS family permease